MSRVEGRDSGLTNNMRKNRAGNFTVEKVYDESPGEMPSSLLGEESIKAAAAAVVIAMLSGSVAASAEVPKRAIVIKGEMPSQKGDILDQLDKSSVSEEIKTTPDLGTIENEKKPEQIIAENVVSFLKAETPHTDEEIKSRLIILSTEKTDDIGVANLDGIQGSLLGFLETEDKENLLMFLGTKDINKERFVTVVRAPLYAILNSSNPLVFNVNQLKGSNYFGSTEGGGPVKDKETIINALSTQLNRNLVFLPSTGNVTNKIIDEYKKYGENCIKYLNDMKQNVPYVRSLFYDLYRNEEQKTNLVRFEDPGLKIRKIRIDDIGVDNVSDIIGSWKNSDMVSIPIILGIRFFLKK